MVRRPKLKELTCSAASGLSKTNHVPITIFEHQYVDRNSIQLLKLVQI